MIFSIEEEEACARDWDAMGFEYYEVRTKEYLKILELIKLARKQSIKIDCFLANNT